MITRSMRTTDTLQELMDFYYDMVPVTPFGKGVFLYQGKRVEGDRRLAMKSTDHIDFYSEMKPDVFVCWRSGSWGSQGAC
jgi:small ubiquitin-related modifier